MTEADSNALGARVLAYIDALADITETPANLTRIFLSPEHRRAADLLMQWMRDAGMSARMDTIGNVVGRYEATTPQAPALLLGSHFDTVRDAGKWDGPLGVVTAIACVHDFHSRGQRFPFAIEIAAFADEEGVRYSSTLLGSRALAGTFDTSLLTRPDANGIAMNDALRSFGLDPAKVAEAARKPADFLGYLELHIEQGPVLEAKAVPVGVVTAISGATRLSVTLTGLAGHAGTVPMSMRQDALTGAAECVLAVESLCQDDADLFGTVGQIKAEPGATNVIPGLARFSVDMRSPSDAHRKASVAKLVAQFEAIAARRKLSLTIDVTHEGRMVPCADWLQQQIGASIARLGYPVLALPSGAGHDGMAIADMTDIGMTFVRCRGGISHNPAEHVTPEDAEVGARVLRDVIENFRSQKT